MGRVYKTDIPNEAKMIQSLWEMIKEFYIPEDTMTYHEEFCKCAREINEECDSRLGQKLILAYADYLDEKAGKIDG